MPYKQFLPVDCSRGAPMGRAEYGAPADCAPRSVAVFKVKLTDGYDDGGVYWGACAVGTALYCAQDTNSRYQAFIRAVSRADAILGLGIPCDRLIRGDNNVTAKRIGKALLDAARKLRSHPTA